MNSRLAIEFICAFGMPPVEFIELAARLECPAIGMAPAPVVSLPGLYPAWNMLEDTALRREVLAALKANGVRVALAEGFLVLPGMDPASYIPALDLAADMGSGVVNACCLAPEMAANADGFGALADLAAARGLKASVEYIPGMVIGNLPNTLELLGQVNRSNAGLLIDAMHLYRSGATTADLAAVDPELILHAQLCDVPMISTFENYADEARFERLAPGEGELPLADFVKALPRHITVGVEVPMRAATESGISAEDRLRPVLASASALLGEN